MSLIITWQNMRNNPVNSERWAQFKNNRRGYWSLWIFITLFVLSLLGELWVNDKPVMLSYQQHWYFPIVQDIPENQLGGDFDISTDYRDPYMVEQIEKLRSKLKPPLIPQRGECEILKQPKIKIGEAICTQNVPTRIAVSVYLRNRKAIRIEPFVHTGVGECAITNAVRTPPGPIVCPAAG